jgi:uncharacterized protein (TIGR03067 family)
MKTFGFGLYLTLAFLLTAALLWVSQVRVVRAQEKVDKAEAAKKELAELQGDWKLMTHEEDGKIVDYGGDTQIYTIAKDQMIVKRKGDVIAEGPIELDATRSLKQMDYRLNSGQVDLIIFIRVGDYLIQCGHRDGKTRPSEFATNTSNGGAYLIVLQRQK